jgi:hypothetical protein
MSNLLASLTEAPIVRTYKRGPEGKVGRTHSLKVLGKQTAYTKKTWHGHYKPVKVTSRSHFEGLDENGNPIWS